MLKVWLWIGVMKKIRIFEDRNDLEERERLASIEKDGKRSIVRT